MPPQDEDQKFHEEYRAKRGKGPFLAADMVVQSADNKVLLIRRGKRPGKGLLALPGGFVNLDETFLDGALRELGEETGLLEAVHPGIRSWIGHSEIFDDPHRDPRGRIVTRAFHLRLPAFAGEVELKAGDDAAEAIWLDDPLSLGVDAFFLDHFSIIATLIE